MNATNATNATHATTATSATSATTATTATTANNANNLGGQPPSAYLSSSAVQHGTFFLNPGTSGKVLFSDGPLSFTADCALSGGVTTVTTHVASSVDNWLEFDSLQATAGTDIWDQLSDTSSPGSFFGSNDRIDFTAPTGTAMRGQDVFGVNYPSAGQCYVSAFVVAN